MSAPDPEPDPAPEAIRVSAVHLAGVRALSPGQGDLELRFSDVGLQVLRRDTREPVGTMPWSEVSSVVLPRRVSLRWGAPRIVVAAAGAEARFSLPGLSARQVRDQLSPLLARHTAGAQPD